MKATGDGLQFQWQKNCEVVHDGSKYSGSNTDTLDIKDVKKSDEGWYHCLVETTGTAERKLSDGANLAIGKLTV